MTSRLGDMYIVRLFLLVAYYGSALSGECPRTCTCHIPGVGSTKTSVWTANCEYVPKDSPINIIDAMPRARAASISIRALNKSNSVPWNLRRSLLSEFKKLSTLEVAASGLELIGGAAFVDLESLTVLDLSDNELGSLAPGSFVSIPQLTTLDLSETSLTYLDGYLFRDLTLTRLNLSHNAISDIDDSTFIGTKTKTLDLSFNNLTKLRPATLRPLNGTIHLDLSYNFISHLDDDLFEGFTNLTTLNLNNNKIMSISYKVFSSVNLPSIEMVSIRYNLIRDFPDDFLKILDSIKLLNIDDNPLSCNCNLLWLKTNYATLNATCDKNLTCFLNTKCFLGNSSVLVFDVPENDFNCTSAEILDVQLLEEDRLVCTARGDPLPDIYWTDPSGKVKENTQLTRVDDSVVASLSLNLHSPSGKYTCSAKGFGKKQVTMVSPTFGIYTAAPGYFSTQELISAVMGTLLCCLVIMLLASFILWRRCTSKKRHDYYLKRYKGASFPL